MKGTIFDIKRFSVNDGPGIRTTVFFKGCPLDCWWCHNPESKDPCIGITGENKGNSSGSPAERELTGYEISDDELMKIIRKDTDYYSESDGGVCFSGGEPLLQADFLIRMLGLCREEGIHTVLDTTGYSNPEVFDRIAGLCNLFYFDLKHPDPDSHLKFTGVSPDTIFINLSSLHRKESKVIIRIPFIPGINDGETVDEFIKLLKENYPIFKTVQILPYHKIAGSKYEKYGFINRMGQTKVPSQDDIDLFKEKFIIDGFDASVVI